MTFNKEQFTCHIFPWGTDYLNAFRQLQELQIRQCEIGSNLIFDFRQKPHLLLESLTRHQLSITGVYEFGHFGIWSKRREVYFHHGQLSRLMRELNLHFVILCSGFRFKNHASSSEQMITMLTEVCKRYDSNGIKVGIHPHAGTSIFTYEEIYHVFNQVNVPIRLVPDTNHLRKAAINPVHLFREFHSYIDEIHIKGMDNKKNDEWMEQIDYLTFLNDMQYNGYLALEIDKIVENPKKQVQRSIHGLTSFFKGDTTET